MEDHSQGKQDLIEDLSSFENLRDKLTTAPIVQYPDFSKPFFLYTDALIIGLGVILAQKNDDQEHVIAYASETLIPAEKNYTITELECLAIVWAVKYFQHYLCESKFTIITDHDALNNNRK
ncbi:7023_t:CDS:2 [Rhizophagus irregularis]|nr:7023_t:CDS:2 [Rhizophagus irregularis]